MAQNLCTQDPCPVNERNAGAIVETSGTPLPSTDPTENPRIHGVSWVAGRLNPAMSAILDMLIC